MRITKTVYVEIGELGYDVGVRYLGDGEIDITSNVVEVSGADSGPEVITYETFEREFIAMSGMSLSDGRSALDDMLCELALDQLSDEYDDSRETSLEDR